jgi:N-acetylglucosaminyldiphosphoundecaprenol N-acetyl-beta-D-mannosaminyltransferase
MQRRLVSCGEQVRGADLTRALLADAVRCQLPVGLYGGKPEVIDQLCSSLPAEFVGLRIVYAYSPPFRTLTAEERNAVLNDIAASGPRLLFVGLGCPKQERWMAAQRGSVDAVMLGVGAAFDMHTGMLPEAPRWVQRSGLEWLHRLKHDPRRLIRRYVRHNPRFAYLALRQLIRGA